MNVIPFPVPETAPGSKQSIFCDLVNNDSINKDIFRLDFAWPGIAPRAGQFFMIKPRNSAVFLARPISVALWEPAATDREFVRREVRRQKTPYQRYLKGKFLESNTVRFLIARRGRGTRELSAMRTGDEAELIGPLGNAWEDFLPKPQKNGKPIALVGGGVGIAPLESLLGEESQYHYEFYAGFKKGLKQLEKLALLGITYAETAKHVFAAENGKEEFLKGRITDFLEPAQYAAVCACGPEAMLKVVADKCKSAAVPCFISMERRMACGVGACLGCTVKTTKGNRHGHHNARCCADGPIFNADEVIFDE